MGDNDFDPDAYLAEKKAEPAFDPDKYLADAKPTFASKAIEPITSYPETYRQQREGSAEMAKQGAQGLWDGQRDEPNPVKAFGKDALNLGRVLAGSLGYVTSPISAALRTTVGKPVEDVTGSPLAGQLAETAAGLPIPYYGITSLRRAPLAAISPAGHVAPEASQAIERLNAPSRPVLDAVDEARQALARQNAEKAKEFGMDLSYGEAAQDPAHYALEDQAATGAYGVPAQNVAAPIRDQRFQQMHGAAQRIGEDVGGNSGVTTPEGAADVINDEVRQHAERIAQTRQNFENFANRDEQAQRGMLEDQQRALQDIIRGSGPEIGGARDAGELVGEGVRQRAAQAREGSTAAYERAFALPGEIHAGAFEGIGTRIKGDLTIHDDPVIIDDVTTPIASRAIQHLDRTIDQLRIQNRADPFGQPDPQNITAVNLRGVDQVRKQLNQFYAAARRGPNPSDARAMGRIVHAFDDQVENAVAGNLFSGDPRALQALRDARGAYRNYVQTFRPQGAADDVGNAMRRIIDRGATPEEVTRMVMGSGALGDAGLPVRLAARLAQVFGRDSAEWSAIRQAFWQQVTSGSNATKIASTIDRFANSSLGRAVFHPEELAAMRSHANAVRSIDNMVETSPVRQQAERFSQDWDRVFSGKDIGGAPGSTFARIANGTARPDEIRSKVFGAIANGKSGDAARLIDAVGRIYGRSSASFNALRQGVWHELTARAPGTDQKGAQRLSQDILRFVDTGVAKQLYTREELAKIRRFGEVVELKTTPPKSQMNPSGSAITAFQIARDLAKNHAIKGVTHAATQTAAVPFGPIGHAVAAIAGHGMSTYLEGIASARAEAAHASRVRRSLEGLPPQRASGGRAMADGGTPDDAGTDLEVNPSDPFGGTFAMPDQSKVAEPLKKAFGADGTERYQLWPERMVRSALTAPADALSGKMQVTDPETGMPTREAVERAGDVAGTAVLGGMPMAERGALGMTGGRLKAPGVSFEPAQAPKPANVTSNRDIVENVVPSPKSLLDRVYDNYTKRMTPDEMLKSEPVWGTAKLIAERDGVPEAQAFADLANDYYAKHGINQFMSPNAARKFLAQERGIAAAPPRGVVRASGGRTPLSTRRESNYSQTRGSPDHHCGSDKSWQSGFCAKFHAPHSCSEVGGFIAKRGACDWFRRAR